MRAFRSFFLLILCFTPALAIRLFLRRRQRRGRAALSWRLSGQLVEDAAPRGFGARDEQIPLLPLLRELRAAGEDPAVEAISLRIGKLHGGWAQLDELRLELLRLRERGRQVFVYLERPGHPEIFLASAADSVAMPPMATLDVVGLRAEVSFYKAALDQLGVEANFEAAGEYKSFAEPFTRDGMSAAFRESLDLVLGGVHHAFLAALADGRNLNPERVQELVDGGPYGAHEARDLGLIDHVRYPDRWRRLLRKRLGVTEPAGDEDEEEAEEGETSARDADRPPLRFRRAHSYLRPWRLLRRLERWSRPGDLVAVVVAEGNIVEGDSEQALPGQVAYRPVAGVLRELATDDRVKAVVLRINSPGGSGAASDLLWREIVRLREKKPVIASMSGTAASGGYYLAMAADQILAGELTITGSIGVVAGKFDLSGLLGKLGITQEVLSYGKNTGLYSATSGLSESERARLREHLDLFYDTFTRKAAEGRRMEQSELEQHARGRIWTGHQAMERGLVDATGGLSDALESAARRAGLGSDWEPWVIEPPHPGLMDRLQRMVPVGLFAGDLVEAPLRALLGGPRELVQARMPATIEIK